MQTFYNIIAISLLIVVVGFGATAFFLMANSKTIVDKEEPYAEV